ncbi:MAG: hypothetical protein ACYC1Q_08955, partial [Bacteroidia bacterium]
EYELLNNLDSFIATMVTTYSIPFFWMQISWQPSTIRIQISEERYIYLDRAKFLQLYQPENAFFIQREISKKTHGDFNKDSIGPQFHRIISGLANKTLDEALSGKHGLSAPDPDLTSIVESVDSQFTPNNIRCLLYSTLVLANCDTLDVDTLSINLIEPVIAGFAIAFNYQRESGAFVGRPVKIGLSYHPLVAQNSVELPDSPLFWMEYNDFTSIATEEELEILLSVLYEFQCWRLSERYYEDE